MDDICADCGGFDHEWMNTCHLHPSMSVCRGCECPVCFEEQEDEDYYEDEDFNF